MSQPLTEQEREILEAAGCGWVLDRIARAASREMVLRERIEFLMEFIRATAQDEGHLSQEAKEILRSVIP